MNTRHTPAKFEEFVCNAPMWLGGCPAGHCGEKSYGYQLPYKYLWETRGISHPPYCHGHACPAHGGPQKDEVRIFTDGLDDDGRPMWCAVMPDFVNLQESPAGFDANPFKAVVNLRSAIAEEQARKKEKAPVVRPRL